MKTYKQHPLGAAWNMLDDDAFKALIDDIDQNGLREKITVYEGMILDGWQRYNACLELNIKNIPTIGYDGDDPAGFVLSKNLHRRHATPSQIAMAIARMAEEWAKHGRPSKSLERAQKTGNVAGFSVAGAAEKAGVSERTMRDAKTATKATEEVQQAVMEGNIPVNKAAKLAKESPEVQQKAVEEAKQPKKRATPKKSETVSQDVYAALQNEYKKAMDHIDTLSSELKVALQELAAVEALRSNVQVQEIMKLHQSLQSMTQARDQWQNKCAELTKQVNYLTKKK